MTAIKVNHVSPTVINLINKHTGGKIGNYTMPKEARLSKDDDGILYNCFLTKRGKYIGDWAVGWWYVKDNLRVEPSYPQGVAKQINKSKSGLSQTIGYVGYSHKGFELFKIGDMLFDEKYKPVKEDFTAKEWNDFQFSLKKAKKEDPDVTLIDVIPFIKRGKIKISNLSQALQAAKNFSKYIS